MDRFQRFLNLPCATVDADFNAIRLSQHRKDFLAKAVDGTPIFLLHDASQAHYSPGIEFKHVKAKFHVTCRVSVGDKQFEEQFALVTIDGAMHDLYELFIRCFAAAIENLPVNSGTRELSDCVQKLTGLFRSLAQPNSKAVTGIWGELFVIANSVNVTSAIASWQVDSFDRFDFSWGNRVLEVKATTQAIRIHHFAVAQLAEPISGSGYVASLMLQPLSGGLGIIDLANTIETKLTNFPDLKIKLWANLAMALGDGFTTKLDKRFDMDYATRHFVLYAMNDIPRPELPSDSRITEIRFTADLATVDSSINKPSFAVLREIF